MEEYSKVNASEYAQMPIGERTLNTELSSDFTLPDYQPEIKRLLKIGASVLPPSKYVGDNQAEFGGNIDYYVFYTGSDNEIYCVPLTGEYKIEMPTLQGVDWSLSNLIGSIDIQPDMISGRVVSPRKINVKCRLKSQARIFGDVATARDFESERDNEMLSGIATASRAILLSGDMLKLSDEMIIDNRDGEIRVVSADGRAHINEINCADGTVNLRGDVYLKMLMMREGGGVPYTVTRKLPFSQSLNVEGAAGRCSACAKATVCEMSMDVEENRILIEVGMLTDVTVIKNERVRYVKDMYSTQYKTDCQYKSMKLSSNASAINANFTLSDSVSLEDAGIAPECSVIDSSGVAMIEGVTYNEDGRMTANGKARFTLLLDRGGEYVCSDVEMPFKYSADVGERGEDTAHALAASVISSRARIDGERVGIDAEIGIGGHIADVKEIQVLDEVSFGDEIEHGHGEILICYPSKSDSIWSVAKRYGSTVSELLRKNHLSDDAAYDSNQTLSGVNYLIV